MKKNLIATTVCAAAVTSSVLAGPAPVDSEKTIIDPPAAGFDAARRPISNPTLFDLAIPRTNVHPIYMYQTMPSRIALAGGGTLPLGGDFSVYALQFEYALNDRFSIIATKDGYIDFNPDNTLNEDDGFADLAAGVKYAFILDPVQQLAVSGSLVVETYSGDSSVWQGNGEGAVNLSVAALKLANQWQFAGALGVHLPFDEDEESVTGFMSAHVGYNITDRLYALAEVNWHHVISEGNGTATFGPQLGSTVPTIAGFEGGDLINLGTANPVKDIVTAAIGVRYRLCDSADLGLAYEIPLTDEEENLMESRITVDLVVTF
ncbi:MAG: hypothetical protein H7A51_09665 [Akkermansiaceae bacterium]|nr:hypothetical protein [Akkermansiaceae bacterium]